MCVHVSCISYEIPPALMCGSDPGWCTNLLSDFILDHARLPVTPITDSLFHSPARYSLLYFWSQNVSTAVCSLPVNQVGQLSVFLLLVMPSVA